MDQVIAKRLQGSNFEISWLRFHQIIENWIFLKSTQKGLLKNFQDGISRPLGSQEIQETKVATVLRDTLYVTAWRRGKDSNHVRGHHRKLLQSWAAYFYI